MSRPTSLSGAKSRANSSAEFLIVKSAPSLSSATATSPVSRNVSKASFSEREESYFTMSLGNGVVKRRVALVIRWVERALVLQ